jgi:hypothetical protein
MSEWDPERERFEPESDFKRDYVDQKVGYPDRTPGRRREDYQRGVWSIGGQPRPAGERAEGPRADAPASKHAGKGPRNYRRADVRLYDEVCDALERHDEIDASDVEVSVRDGHVTLTGSVADGSTVELAGDVVVSCPGVRDVNNRLGTRGDGER